MIRPAAAPTPKGLDNDRLTREWRFYWRSLIPGLIEPALGVGIGIGIAAGIDIRSGGQSTRLEIRSLHLDSDPETDTDSDTCIDVRQYH